MPRILTLTETVIMRLVRPNRPFAQLVVPARFATLASLTASLLLGACSQSPGLLPSMAMKQAPTETSDITPTGTTGPQTELQKATMYWGQEYAKKPTDLQAALSYARDLKAMGEKQKALAVLQQASMLHDTSRELAGEYGRLALELDQVGAANQLLAVADDPTKPDWRVISARGTVMAKQGKYSDAIPFYERALTLSQNNPTVMNNLAMAYAMMGDPKKAEEILRQAVTTDGASPKVRENLALVLGLQGRYDESRSVGAGVLNSEVASANTSYLKQMVKLEPKSAMPDAQSFANNTAVAKVAPVQQSTESNVAANVTAHAAPGPATPSTPEAWQTSVDSATPTVALKDADH
jgi:Flp pilus assembly protein TadD